MKKLLLSMVGIVLLGLSSCTKEEDAALETFQERNLNDNARLECDLCLAPAAQIMSVSPGTNCSNILNIKLYLDYNVPVVIEKSSNGTSWIPVKYVQSSDYTLSAGVATISFTDLNPYQPAGNPVPSHTYYRVKLVLSSPVYSSIQARATVAGCSGLPNTVFSLNPTGGIVTSSFANLKVDWNAPLAVSAGVAGGVSSYNVTYDVKQGSSYIGSGNLSVSGSNTSTFIPVSSGPYSGSITVTVSVWSVFPSGYSGSVTFSKIINTGGV